MASHESDRVHEANRYTHQLFTPLTRFEHETLVDAIHDAYVDDDEPLLDIHDRDEQRRQEQATQRMAAQLASLSRPRRGRYRRRLLAVRWDRIAGVILGAAALVFAVWVTGGWWVP
jgi:hypothetical protein